MQKKWKTGKGRMSILLHIVAWMIIFILPLYLLSIREIRPDVPFGRFYLQSVSYVVIFYLSYFWLVPRFWLAGRKYVFLGVSLVIMSVIYMTLDQIDNHVFPPPKDLLEKEQKMSLENPDRPRPESMRKRFFLMNFLFTAVLINGFTIGLRVSEQLSVNEEKRKELEREKLNSELAFLKSQISPHFFFNTLNNIYSLITHDQEVAQESVLKLSKLMRYLLYESENGSTLLSREVDFMKNYIDLMRLRVSEKVSIHAGFPVDGPDPSIPPLLFIPFIENAFKHGISYQQPTEIRIGLTSGENRLVFSCENSIGRTVGDSDVSGSGIGLENVRKRLHLLYPHRHRLDISQENNRFRVSLVIENPEQVNV